MLYSDKIEQNVTSYISNVGGIIVGNGKIPFDIFNNWELVDGNSVEFTYYSGGIELGNKSGGAGLLNTKIFKSGADTIITLKFYYNGSDEIEKILNI